MSILCHRILLQLTCAIDATSFPASVVRIGISSLAHTNHKAKAMPGLIRRITLDAIAPCRLVARPRGGYTEEPTVALVWSCVAPGAMRVAPGCPYRKSGPMAQSVPSPSVHPTAALVGTAPAICALREQIRHLATFDTLGNPYVPTLLVHGETG